VSKESAPEIHPEQNSPEDPIQQIANEVLKRLGGAPPEVEKLPGEAVACVKENWMA
jgi:hypothetical protein